MNKLRFPIIVILAPPFYSHFNPLLALARAFASLGTRVIIGTSPDFRADAENAGFEYREVRINKNANRGVAVETEQEDAEARRLREFLEATTRGPVETLITQGRHRTDDMFANPEQLIESIRDLNDDLHPSLWVADQLSYGATLALMGLDLPFATFCAPHPYSIPTGDMTYSVPPEWPGIFRPSPEDEARLISAAREVERDFTSRFNKLLSSHFSKEGVKSAFSATSSIAVICNYPPFPNLRAPGRLFAGHSFSEHKLPETWASRIDPQREKILIALGTFLSSRGDVLRKLIEGILSARPDAQVFVGAGPNAGEISKDFDRRVIAESFIPQRALLPHVDAVFHHGGVSSFTETLYMGKPMAVLPFSSDQFNVARDVERHRLGAVCDPNRVSPDAVEEALEILVDREIRKSVEDWSGQIRGLGPESVVRELQSSGGINGQE
jgi:UDP:flavonoid glycosyltransferase YjiC (YdhE family)